MLARRNKVFITQYMNTKVDEVCEITKNKSEKKNARVWVITFYSCLSFVLFHLTVSKNPKN
jgi:hypothetical protein